MENWIMNYLSYWKPVRVTSYICEWPECGDNNTIQHHKILWLTIDNYPQWCLCNCRTVMPDFNIISSSQRQSSPVKDNSCFEVVDSGDNWFKWWRTHSCQVCQSNLSLLEVNWRLNGKEYSQRYCIKEVNGYALSFQDPQVWIIWNSTLD